MALVEISNHARWQMSRRGIGESLVRDVIRVPDAVEPSVSGTVISSKTIGGQWGRTLCVVSHKRPDGAIVVRTVYWKDEKR